MNYEIKIDTDREIYTAYLKVLTELEMKAWAWDVINHGWLKQDDNKYFFVPASRINWIEAEKKHE